MIIAKPVYIHFVKEKIYKPVYFAGFNCPDCGQLLKVRDSKRRTVKDNNGNTIVFALNRLYCTNCKKLHTLLPDCIVPNKHYLKATIEDCRAGRSEDCAADDSTIRRWRR